MNGLQNTDKLKPRITRNARIKLTINSVSSARSVVHPSAANANITQERAYGREMREWIFTSCLKLDWMSLTPRQQQATV